MTEPQTLPAALDAAVERDPAHAFMRCDGRHITVAELQAASRRVAASLRDWGLQPGDRVAVMLGNVPEFVSVWFGILRAGCVEVPVHSAHRGALLEHILAESDARLLFCEGEFVPRLTGLALPALERIVVRGDAAAGAPARVEEAGLEEALDGADDESLDLPATTARDVSCLLYTSGTTGRSKGVVLTHGANLRLARANVELMEYDRDDVLYTAFPLFHVNAKFTSVVSAMISGARLVLDRKFSASRFWETMRREGVTSFNYLGGMLAILASQPASEEDRRHSVDRAYGAACPPDLWQPFEERFGVQLFEHYGMTEIGIAVRNTRTVRRRGSIGQPAPYFEIRLADDEERAVTDGQVGEIQVRPNEPDVMLREYWKRPDATLEAFRNLWFHTGDRARADADGFLYYVDRVTDSIRRRGENISSFELESVVGAHPGVAECAAYGVPSELGEEEVMVAIVPDPSGLDRDDFFAYCEARVSTFAVPRYLRLVSELPRNSSQRVQKFRLRDEGVTADTFDRLDGAAQADATRSP